MVLTGGLDDGSAGLQAIKQCGGLAIVQDPATAEDLAMPSAAQLATAVDHCVPLEAIAPLLTRLVEEPIDVAIPPPAPAATALMHEHLASLEGVRTMDELRKIATLDRAAGDEARARRSEAEADALREQARIVRDLAEAG